MMIAQPTDIAIFLVSFAACIYCIVLSRRLRALQNTKDGLGATIMALSNSISAMSTTKEETRVHAEELASRLAHLLEEAGKTCARIESATRTMDSKHTHAIQQVEAAKKDLGASLQAALEETKSQILEMTTQIRQMQTYYNSKNGPELEDTSLFDTPHKYGA